MEAPLQLNSFIHRFSGDVYNSLLEIKIMFELPFARSGVSCYEHTRFRGLTVPDLSCVLAFNG